MNNFNNTSKGKLIIIGSIMLVILIIATVIYAFMQQRSEYDEGLNIANLSEYTRGKPNDKKTLDYIKYDLHRVVSMNSKNPVENNSIKDILVRKDSFSQTYNGETRVHNVEFIVDSSSLKQSYDISYQWMGDTSIESALDEWGTVVKCLPIEDLIYGDFSCKDMFTELANQEDPIMEYLPYSTPNVSITYAAKYEKTLDVKIETSAADERDNPEKYINQYKQEAKDWIKSKNLDPDEYTLSYTIIHASIY